MGSWQQLTLQLSSNNLSSMQVGTAAVLACIAICQTAGCLQCPHIFLQPLEEISYLATVALNAGMLLLLLLVVCEDLQAWLWRLRLWRLFCIFKQEKL
jgi:hypothetical protein